MTTNQRACCKAERDAVLRYVDEMADALYERVCSREPGVTLDGTELAQVRALYRIIDRVRLGHHHKNGPAPVAVAGDASDPKKENAGLRAELGGESAPDAVKRLAFQFERFREDTKARVEAIVAENLALMDERGRAERERDEALTALGEARVQHASMMANATRELESLSKLVKYDSNAVDVAGWSAEVEKDMSVVRVGGLHSQVRIVETGHIAVALYDVELFDGEEWLPSSRPLPIEKARARAKWLSDVLRFAERKGRG